MGIFGWIGKKAKAAGNKISGVYKDFTGQATFEKADRMYDDVMRRFEAHKSHFEDAVDTLSREIETKVEAINNAKRCIKTELFPAFAYKMKHLKDIPVSDKYLKEYFSGSTLTVDQMKEKADLYLIDFKKKPFKNNALAILTLGFYTRKKAKETLETVTEERKRIEEEMARMDSEMVKLGRIKDSLELISEFYLSLIDIYHALLNRLDNSIGFLMIRCISQERRLISDHMSIRLLPKSQQDEIMGMVSISKVLKTMVEKSITMKGRTEMIDKSLKGMKEEIHAYREQIIKEAI